MNHHPGSRSARARVGTVIARPVLVRAGQACPVLVRSWAAVVLAMAVVVGGGCGAVGRPSGSDAATIGSGGVGGRIIVLAAASLTETFTELGRRFERAHPGTDVTFSFGPSSQLAAQVVQGVPADVVATASSAAMGQARAVVATPQVFARNSLQLAVPPDNPARINALDDLTRPDVTVALCQAQVPCGAATAQALSRQGVRVAAATEEEDVKAVLTKVQLGEVDVGVVYVTDVRAAGDTVRGVPLPAAQNVTTDYPIATVADSRNLATAQAFVDLVRSVEGRQLLAGAGFSVP
ncbi:MAG: molybdate ABC transporter substrate-binding protein [Angustibacter sp.]